MSDEAPTFATDSKFGDLLVVVVPQHGPQIQGAHERYSKGDRVEMNCTVAATMPPANSSWYINQRLVSGRQLQHHPVLNWTSAREGRLHTASLGLHHTLTRRDFRHNNGVKFKCVAAIYDAYYKVRSPLPTPYYLPPGQRDLRREGAEEEKGWGTTEPQTW